MARTSTKPQQKRAKQENGRKSKKSSSKVTATGGGGRILASKRRGSLRKVDNQRKAKQSGRAKATAQDLRLRGRTVQLANSPRAGSSRRPSASAGSRRGVAKASSAKSKATKRPRSASVSAKANTDSSRSVPDHDLELVPRRWDDDGRPVYTRRGRQMVMDMKTRMRNQAPELVERELRGGRIVFTEKRKSGKK
ncbi:Hypp5551 [Branchiostoma lanceolatum]|uniref:Hypp5551 protein n=1 Tax=Branchiostoma lanceolatum TaxID=7740 RepID=A0A8J9W6J1_BRALA|nr:Hypp5551 [Branchiostoma lanceolatum]